MGKKIKKKELVHGLKFTIEQFRDFKSKRIYKFGDPDYEIAHHLDGPHKIKILEEKTGFKIIESGTGKTNNIVYKRKDIKRDINHNSTWKLI